MPCLVEDEAKDTGEPEDDEPFLELGDRLFATVSIPNVPISVIAPSGTTAQQLAKQALRSIPTKEKDLIPPYLQDFNDIFDKESFDLLPKSRTWDHAIELDQEQSCRHARSTPCPPVNNCS